MGVSSLNDMEIVILELRQFYALMKEDRQVKEQACRLSPPSAPQIQTERKIFQSEELSPVFPLNYVDQFNETLKDYTYADMFSWKDAYFSGQNIAKQITIPGLTGRAVLTQSKNGKFYVIIKGLAGLRTKLKGTRYLRSNPIFTEAEFIFGKAEMLREGLKATKVGLLVLIPWEAVHELCQERASWIHLGVTIVCDVLQALVALAVGALLGLVAALILPNVVVIIGIFGFGASFFAGMAMTYADKTGHHTDHLTDIMKKIRNSDHPLTAFKEHAKSIGKECMELLSGHAGSFFRY